MPKNIVICFDGTGNEFRARRNTNVVRLFRVLARSDAATQVAFYDPGVGTSSAPGAQLWITKFISKVLGLAFGAGIMRNIADGYRFLMQRYQAGDRVFIFGFSRGAYSARALAGMLHFCGLLDDGSENLVDYALRVFTERTVGRPKWATGWRRIVFAGIWLPLWLANRTEPDWARAAGFKRTFGRHCSVHFIGVWDTVKSVGWFRRRVVLPHTANLPDLRFGRHAVALDEKRSQYRPNLWAYPNQNDPAVDIQQVWFAGVHSDVGGSYEEDGLADVTLQWMLDGARRHGLLVDQAELARIRCQPNPSDQMHNPLLPFWWLLGWRRRRVPHGAWIHDSARQRIAATASSASPYRPEIPSGAHFVK